MNKNTSITQFVIGCIFLLNDFVGHAISELLGENSPYYFIYYLAAFFMDLWIVFKLAEFEDEMWIAHLMMINIAGACAALYGLIIWYFYVPPNSFNYIIYTLAILQWIRLLWVSDNGKAPTGHSSIYKYMHRIRAFNFRRLEMSND